MWLKRAYGRSAAALIKVFIRGVYRPVCVNKAHFESPVIYVVNHTCHMDGLVMLAALSEEKPYALTAKDWFDKKLFEPVFTAARCLPLNRFGLDTSWLRSAAEKLRKGSNVIVFPEGHTVHTGELEAFKPGFAMLSRLTGAKIVPVWHGEYRPFRKTRIIFGEPQEICCSAMTAEALTFEGERFRELVDVLGKAERGAEN